VSFPSIVRVSALLALLAPGLAFSAGGGGEYAPIIGAGLHFYAGDTGKSLTGQSGYFLDLQAEKRKGVIRPSILAELSISSGTASIGTAEPSYSMYGSAFLAGANVFIFTQGRFQPFIGGFGVASWSMLKLSSAPAGVEENTTSLGFGYEIVTGADLRFGSADGRAVRIQGGFWSSTSGLGGVSGFQHSGFRLQLGIVY
jgi:hypothetical protein